MQSLPNFLCMLPMSVARSSSGTLTIGHIAYRREWGVGSAQRGRSVIYDSLFFLVIAESSVVAVVGVGVSTSGDA